MMQTKYQSLIETLLNIGSGFFLALIMQVLVAWWYDLPLKFSQNVEITIIFTIVSVTRSYAWRRYFNKRHNKENNK